MQLPVKSKLNTFITRMDNGAIYWEFSDGYRIAMAKDVYEYVTPNTTEKPYREFIDKLICDKRTRHLTKVLYKAFNTLEPLNPASAWVNLLKVYQTGVVKNVYTYAWDNKTVISIDTSIIKSVEYIDKTFTTHIISECDGTVETQTNHAPVSNFPMKDRNVITIEQYNVENPSMVGNYHLKQDIKITVDHNYGDFENIIAWVGGVFVVHDFIDPENLQEIVLQKAKMFLKTRVVGYKGLEPLTPKSGNDACATYEPDPAREDKRWDFDIRIFKWRNVKVSNWISPTLSNYDQYIHHDDNIVGIVKEFAIDYIASLFFNDNIDENHILLLNGIVVDREDYDIVGDEIRFKGIRQQVTSLIDDAYREYVDTNEITNVKLISNIVESLLPKGDDFNLIKFSHVDPTKTVTLNRSNQCYKNHPYPYCVTLPQYNVGDMILVDGVFEKYRVEEHNVIRYPLTEHTPISYNGNFVTESKIERLWFTE